MDEDLKTLLRAVKDNTRRTSIQIGRASNADVIEKLAVELRTAAETLESIARTDRLRKF